MFRKNYYVMLLATVVIMFASSLTVHALDWSSLNKKGIYQPDNQVFRNGYMCVLTNDGWNYIDKGGKLIDLNKGRFSLVFPFFKGLAAVIDYNDKVGYIDMNGNIVIPCQYGLYWGKDNIYVGHFNDGKATVFKQQYSNISIKNKDGEVSYVTPEMFLGKVDSTGKLVEDYVSVEDGSLDGWNIMLDNGTFVDEKIPGDSETTTTTPTETPAVPGTVTQPTTPTQTQVDTTPIASGDSPSDWAQNEVYAANALGLLTQSTKSSFKSNVTRLQFAELVVNMVEKSTGKEIKAASTSTFSDTNNNAVLKAYGANIVNGIDLFQFAPNECITREQIATMLYRAITYVEKNKGQTYTIKTASLSSFTDKKKVSSWATESVGVLANNKIMMGTSATTLSPSGNVTIEQSILLAYRIYNLVK